ncbi:MAG TPA: hypothetical protein VMG12_36995 [Polyangiaceae bacterium]|nr:hypothetical protein [Polyangiaceae bacterium]
MKTTPIPSTRASTRAALPGLLLALAVGALQGASGCGRAESPEPIDSETHWLMSCDSDLDCGAGSCECGVCTQTCATSAECSGLGVAGVECVPRTGVCGASGDAAGGTSAAETAGSVCLLACDGDDDCSALGAGAVCESRRCERAASTVVDGVGGASNTGGSGSSGGAGGTSDTALCDGSEDVRFVYVTGGGFVSDYYAFGASEGSSFLAVDGQCRFWRMGPGWVVTSGTLSPADASSFSNAVGYERFTELAPYEDDLQCPDAGTSRIWSPANQASCICGCDQSPEGQGWLPAFRAMSASRLDAWFGDAPSVTGPARLALINYPEGIADSEPLPWPLLRPPADDEIVTLNPLRLDESSGVEITDPNELSTLRATRDAYLAIEPGRNYTPLVFTLSDNPQQGWFHMLLRDELPAKVRAALAEAQSP